jgi:predicted dehydrogenase
MKLRLGFIGVGVMGLSQLNSMQRLGGGDVEVTAVADPCEANLQQALKAATAAQAFRDPAALIQSPVDAVFVSTPNFTHAELALAIIGAGKHLFLEKPCGITRDECFRVLEAAEKSERVVMVGHELRYSPYFQKIKQLVDAGEIGSPRLVWCREFRGPFQPKVGNWIQDDRRSGGCLVDKNCHHFDLMNWWVGSKPARIAAFGGCAVNRVIEGEHQVHDHVTASFEYENGVRGSLQLCMFAHDFPQEELEMGIVGDQGSLQTRIAQIEILQWRRGAKQTEPIVHKIAAKPGEGWGSHLGFDEIHQAFLGCVREGREPLTSVRNSIHGTLLAIAGEEAIRKGEIVNIQ